MEEKDEKEIERQIQLLKQLSVNETFIAWRNLVAKPVIDQLEEDLNNADTMPEAVLRAKVKYIALVKELFYGVFEKIK